MNAQNSPSTQPLQTAFGDAASLGKIRTALGIVEKSIQGPDWTDGVGGPQAREAATIRIQEVALQIEDVLSTCAEGVSAMLDLPNKEAKYEKASSKLDHGIRDLGKRRGELEKIDVKFNTARDAARRKMFEQIHKIGDLNFEEMTAMHRREAAEERRVSSGAEAALNQIADTWLPSLADEIRGIGARITKRVRPSLPQSRPKQRTDGPKKRLQPRDQVGDSRFVPAIVDSEFLKRDMNKGLQRIHQSTEVYQATDFPALYSMFMGYQTFWDMTKNILAASHDPNLHIKRIHDRIKAIQKQAAMVDANAKRARLQTDRPPATREEFVYLAQKLNYQFGILLLVNTEADMNREGGRPLEECVSEWNDMATFMPAGMIRKVGLSQVVFGREMEREDPMVVMHRVAANTLRLSIDSGLIRSDWITAFFDRMRKLSRRTDNPEVGALCTAELDACVRACVEAQAPMHLSRNAWVYRVEERHAEFTHACALIGESQTDIERFVRIQVAHQIDRQIQDMIQSWRTGGRSEEFSLTLYASPRGTPSQD